jgi:two-component system, NarL family, nitrate/nitrite sensor histidine kinase NarX
VKLFINQLRAVFESRWIPWILAACTVLVALFHEVIRPPWLSAWSKPAQAAFWAFILVMLLAGHFYLRRLRTAARQQAEMQQRIIEAEHQVADSYQRLQAIFQVSQKFVEASDESEVIQLVLRLSVELVGATGASFVPLDERGQPLAAISRGVLPFTVMNDWVEYLASPAVRDRCRTCESQAVLTTSCPLLKGPVSEAIGMFCLPLRRGDREFGVLNLFLPNVVSLDAQTQAFLKAMTDETALALEGVRLRHRELEAVRQIQAVRQRADYSALLNSLLENVHQTMEADFVMLVVPQPGSQAGQIGLSYGDFPQMARPFLDGVLRGVIASGEPLSLGDVAGDPISPPGVRSVVAAPLLSAERQSMGAILAGSRRHQGINQRQLVLLQTIAGQVALVIQNTNLMAELEYKTILDERTRLAREIHDGLAQTLGFLKLQIAQMQNYIVLNDMERLRQSTDLCYASVSEAYQDVRQAIDGLRIGAGQGGLQGWLEQIAVEFTEITGLPVKLDGANLSLDLLPEVHAQLIRVVQEAFSNVRKHAQANQVWISGIRDADDFWLEIRDDGKGFSPEDVSAPSQHGLRGMRERAELIGADFQIVSRPGEGTIVRIRLPLKLGEIPS